MENCVFCKMVNGDISVKKIFESDRFFAVLDQNPVTEGHTLLIPKAHYEKQTDMPAEDRANLGNSLGAVADLLNKFFGDNMNISNTSGEFASQSVPHFHIHLIPRHEGDRLWDGDKSRIVLDRSSGFERLKPSKEEIEQLANKLIGDKQ